ncbi:MAG: hypothetical protein QXI33_02385 [Candidatus Pacearchaeota archaeon]
MKFNLYNLGIKFSKYTATTFILLLFFISSSTIVLSAVIEVESQPDNTVINIEGQVSLPRCVIISSNNDVVFGAYWIESNNTQTNALTNCNRIGVNSQGTQISSCCPTGFQCNNQTRNCERISVPEVSCSDLSYSQCESATPSMIKNSIYRRISQLAGVSVSSLNDFCTGNNVYRLQNATSCSLLTGPCKCKWTGTQSNGRCVDKIVSTSCSDPNTQQLTCETRKSELIDKCDTEGVYEVTWIGVLYNPDGSVSNQRVSWCQSGSRTFPCPQRNLVPFFNLWNLLFSLGMIIIVYLLFSTYKNRRHYKN